MSTIKSPRKTKKFQALLAVAGSDEKAVAAWNRLNPDSPIAVKTEVPAEVADLVAAGFSVEEAQAALELAGQEVKPEAPKPVTSKEAVEAAIAQAGLVPVRGRVYVSPTLLEAQARVLKTGKPEIVKNDGTTRTKGVAVYRTDDGKAVALQNLGVPN